MHHTFLLLLCYAYFQVFPLPITLTLLPSLLLPLPSPFPHTQVTTAAVNKQLHAWHIPHTTCNATAEDAFLSLYPAHALPQVMLAAGATPPPHFRDGTPRTGLSLENDIVVIDCKDHYLGGDVSGVESDDALVPVLQMLAKDKVGVVLLLRDPAVADKHTRKALEAAADWGGKPPVLLAKPMVSEKRFQGAL